MERWSIYIDVEGFSEIYASDKVQALIVLGVLSKYLFRIGSKAYPREEERLYIHQLGDGFVIVSDFPEKTLERPISIAIVLMQMILLNGGTARAGVSHGGFADVLGCYPDEIGDNLIDSHYLRIGAGIMTIFQVMGDALINSHKLVHKSPKGPCLIVDPDLINFIPKTVLSFCKMNHSLILVDWIHSSTPIVKEIYSAIGEYMYPPNVFENLLKQYIKSFQLNDEWLQNAMDLISNKDMGSRLES